MSRYKTARALEMAVKSAAQKSEMDTGSAVAGFFFHRLLVRIFSDPASPFVLKGGHGALARTIDARRTRDIDIMSNSLDLDEALAELRRLISLDLDDYLIFDMANVGSIKTNDRYRDGYSVTISVSFGGRTMQPISIDLVSDVVDCGRPERIAPADRIDIPDLFVCDYPVYPVTMAVVDKFCGITERHDGRPSSRVKDLVDLVVYLTHEPIDGGELADRLQREASIRGIALPGFFSLPDEWRGTYERTYRHLVNQTSLGSAYPSMADAEMLVAGFFGPVLDNSCQEKRWDNKMLTWLTDANC